MRTSDLTPLQAKLCTINKTLIHSRAIRRVETVGSAQPSHVGASQKCSCFIRPGIHLVTTGQAQGEVMGMTGPRCLDSSCAK